MKKKAQAGLNIFLGIIVMIFMIGIIVMTFTIAGSKLESAIGETDTSGTITQVNFNMTDVNGGSNLTICGEEPDGVLKSIISVENTSKAGAINSGNYTFSACKLYPRNEVVGQRFNNTLVNVSYTYSWTSNANTQQVIHDTTMAIGDAPNWFGIFIVMGALVVLILMIVLIIGAIRQSGYGGGGLGGNREGG